MIPDFKTYIRESVWGDMRKRAEGWTEREEDSIDNLDFEEFVDHLRETYDTGDDYFYQIGTYPTQGTSIMNLSIPIEKNEYDETPNMSSRMLTIQWDKDTEKYICISPNQYIFKLYPNELKTTFKDEFDIDVSGQKLIPKDGIITNSVCMKVIDKLINMVERPILEKI